MRSVNQADRTRNRQGCDCCEKVEKKQQSRRTAYLVTATFVKGADRSVELLNADGHAGGGGRERGVGEARIRASGAAAKAGDGTAQRGDDSAVRRVKAGGSSFSFLFFSRSSRMV